jgi:hypothetical protein
MMPRPTLTTTIFVTLDARALSPLSNAAGAWGGAGDQP